LISHSHSSRSRSRSPLSLLIMYQIGIQTPDEIMTKGLYLEGYDRDAQNKMTRARKLDEFNSIYGSLPVVIAAIWDDLLTSDDDDIRLKANERTNAGISAFFRAHTLLYHYPTLKLLARFFEVSVALAKGEVLWNWIEKMQGLKAIKIVWQERWNDPESETFIITVDGVHCTINEPNHPEYSKNKKYYSHKNHTSGFNYELALSVQEQKLVWMNGPFPAGRNDVGIFRETEGLKEKILACAPGKKAIADQGYRGKDLVGAGLPVATSCSLDSIALRTFKGRMKARHESFNGRIKNFFCLSHTFRHPIRKHKAAFEAVCVIVQYQMENGRPLFN
jgi:hypothetical protein